MSMSIHDYLLYPFSVILKTINYSTVQFFSCLSGLVNNNNIYRVNKVADYNLLHDVNRLVQRTKCFIIGVQYDMNNGEKSDLIKIE